MTPQQGSGARGQGLGDGRRALGARPPTSDPGPSAEPPASDLRPPDPDPQPPVRLARALSMLGHCSRREAEKLVAEGRVEVNGGQVTAPATLVKLGHDAIVVDGRGLGPQPPAARYIALYKPRGVVTSVRDPHAEHTVMELVPTHDRLYPVSRLDKDSEGLILMTNDGAFANRVAHPRYGTEKEYLARVAEPPSEEFFERLRSGVLLDGRRTRLVLVARDHSRVPTSKRRSPGTRNPERGCWIRIVLHEGRNREVRRMLASVGNPALRLVRTRIGPVRLGKLDPGECRDLTTTEVLALAGRVATDRGRGIGDRGQGTGARGLIGPVPPPRGRAREGGPNPPPLPASSREGRARTPRPSRRVATDPRLQIDDRRPLVVAIDGPSAAGKSTVGARLAQRLGAHFLDTGVLYRVLTFEALRRGMDLNDGPALATLAGESDIHIVGSGADDDSGRVLCGGRDVTREIRSSDVDAQVSRVAAHPEVRAALVPVQRRAAGPGRVVVVGRDIGTVIFPDAHVKIFLEASLPERARRRAQQSGATALAEAVERQLQERDALDRTREVAPLRPAADAIVIHTDGVTADEVVEQVAEYVRERVDIGE